MRARHRAQAVRVPASGNSRRSEARRRAPHRGIAGEAQVGSSASERQGSRRRKDSFTVASSGPDTGRGRRLSGSCIRHMLLVAALCLTLAPNGSCELPHGRCIWDVEMPSELTDWLGACEGGSGLSKRAEAAIERHAYMHGWASEVADLDLVPRDRNAPCKESVLEALADAPRWLAEIDSIRNTKAVALCLERNGRVDAALAVLDRTLNGLDDSMSSDAWLQPFADSEMSDVAGTAAEIAAAHGRWDAALTYATRWTPTAWCGHGIEDQRAGIDAFRARCMLRLGRTSEVREQCVAQARRAIANFGDIANTWLDSFASEGDDVEPEVALQMLVTFVGSDAPRDVSQILADRRLERATADTLLSSPESVVRASRDRVVSLVRSADDETVRRLVAPLLDDQHTTFDQELAWMLAPSGNPIVGRAIDHLLRTDPAAADSNSILKFRGEWERARAWLDKLSQP